MDDDVFTQGKINKQYFSKCQKIGLCMHEKAINYSKINVI